jgi:hypothetical protein
MTNRKLDWKKIVIVILVVIGAITVLDNVWRLTKEMSHAVVSTVQHHDWSLNIVD